MSTVNIADIRVNGGTQSRASIDRGVVSDYADAIRDGTTFPPIIVYFDGSSYWLADGFHRYEAYSAAQVYDVPADVRQGTQRDAILFSVGANASHGLRRTNGDKRRAVLTLLNDSEWAAWPQTKIAQACGVSREYVSRVSKDVSCDRSQDSPVRTVTRNGTTYQQNTANIGASSSADPISVEPEAPVSGSVNSTGPTEPPLASKPKRTGLTLEALEEESAALKEQVAELRSKLSAANAEKKRLKDLLTDLQSDDTRAVIRKLNGQIEHMKSQMFRQAEAMTLEKRKAYKLQKRVDELERLPIDMGAL